MFSSPTSCANFDVRAVQGANGQRPVEGKLHIACPRRFHASGRNLLTADQPLG